MTNRLFVCIWRRHDKDNVRNWCTRNSNCVVHVKPISKPFDLNQYNQDDPAKDILVAWLKAQGFRAHVNPDKYGIDVLSNWFGDDTGVEVEVKHNWNGEEFPFKTIHYAARKFKFLDGNKQVKFVTFNHKRTHMIVVDAKEFTKIVTKETKYTSDETFYEIAIENTELISLEE